MTPLDLDASLDSLGTIGKFIEELSKDGGLTREQAYKLRLAVDEIATNIIVHGYQEQGVTGRVLVRGDVTDDEVSLTLEDTGPPFDPRGHEMPGDDELTKPLDERDIGGLGVYLAVNSVDDFRYERRGDTNVNTFVVRRKS